MPPLFGERRAKTNQINREAAGLGGARMAKETRFVSGFARAAAEALWRAGGSEAATDFPLSVAFGLLASGQMAENIESHLVEKRVFKPAEAFAQRARVRSLQQ